MLHIQKRISEFSYCLTFLMCCCWIMNSGIAYGQNMEDANAIQGMENANTIQEMEDTDRDYDFEVGQIESLSEKMIIVNGQQFFITADTQFNNFEGTPINDRSGISEGVKVAISFYPYEETAIVVELLPDKNYNTPLKEKSYPKVKKRKKEVIVLKNGVYRN